MHTYNEFSKHAVMLFAGSQMGLSESVLGSTSEEFSSNLITAIRESHIFNIGEDVKRLLMMTKPPNLSDRIRLPFPTIFVNCSFSSDELVEMGIKSDGNDIVGIAIQEGNLIDSVTGNYAGIGLRLTCLLKNDEEFYFHTFNENINLINKYQDKRVNILRAEKISPKLRKFVHHFSVNFLNLINDPEIELVEQVISKERNFKREKRGKMPMRNMTFVRLDLKRRIYLDRMLKGESFSYSYAFWVRGHWRTLRHKRYGEHQGKKIWLIPFLKGNGIVVKKEYEVEQHGISTD